MQTKSVMKSFQKSIISASGEEDSSDAEAGWNTSITKIKRDQTDTENVSCKYTSFFLKSD